MSNNIFSSFTSGWDIFEYILYCYILWWISYYFVLIVSRQSEEWCCRFLTFIHGCLISYSAIKDIVDTKSPMDFNGLPLTPVKNNYLSYMLSYFLFDFFWIQFFGNETWIIYTHHLSSILIIILVLFKNYGAPGVSYAVAGLELSNPYLQLRWFLRTHGYVNKPIHKITELWFMCLFFVLRMIGGSVLLYKVLMVSKTDIAIKISVLTIFGISLILQWQIFFYFGKKYLSSGSLNFINSAMSISPYFQRTAFENPNYREEDAADDDKSREETLEMPETTRGLEAVSGKEEEFPIEEEDAQSQKTIDSIQAPEDETNVDSMEDKKEQQTEQEIRNANYST